MMYLHFTSMYSGHAGSSDVVYTIGVGTVGGTAGVRWED